MRGFRLFERPVGAFVTLPPLQVVGSLTSYEEGEPYEGRLDIVGAVGRCHVEIVEEDTHLPPGSYAYVDNFNQQVVLKWPAYRPPAPTDDEIINPDFQEGMDGWNDLQGNSWSVRKYEDDDTNVGPGDRPRPPGNLAAWMTGAGRGDHVLESIRYPVQSGQYITARALWDQGPSNKDNNNLFTALGLYRDGQFIEQVLGDRIHDRTNRTRHWSAVDHLIQPGIDAVTVRLIAHRRNGRNREIIVDNVETSGLRYETGNDSEYEFYFVKFKVTDSANRVAYWDGVIISAVSLMLATPPYPIVEVDEFRSGGEVVGLFAYPSVYEDGMQSTGRVVALSLEVTKADHEYDHAPDELDALMSTGEVIALELEASVIYTEYDHAPEDEDALVSTGEVLAIDMEVTTNYVAYGHNPEDSIDDHLVSTGIVTGIEMQ